VATVEAAVMAVALRRRLVGARATPLPARIAAPALPYNRATSRSPACSP
jgi:hypothetical protein